MRNYFFIVNPAAARGRSARIAELVKDFCQLQKIDFQMVYTKAAGHATDLAAEGAGSFHTVVVIGGDGTINESVNGLIGQSVQLGIIPVGTGNDFVRALGIPTKPRAAFDTVIHAKTRSIDLALANSRYFMNGLGVGFDAWVVEQSLNMKYIHGSLMYLTAVLKTLFTYKSPRIQLTYNGKLLDERFFMITAGNGTSLGGGFKLTPNAILDDGLLDLNIICDLSRIKVLRHLIGVYSGNHIYIPEVTTGRTTQLSFQSEEGFAAHVDGELMALNLKTLEVHIVPKALDVIVPKIET